MIYSIYRISYKLFGIFLQALREKDHVVNESILETNVKSLISQQEKEIGNLRNQLLERVRNGSFYCSLFLLGIKLY